MVHITCGHRCDALVLQCPSAVAEHNLHNHASGQLLEYQAGDAYQLAFLRMKL